MATTLTLLGLSEWLGLDQDKFFVVILTAIGCFTAIVISLAGIIYSCVDAIHRRRNEADLKREMLDRGMSAEEIAKVIEAAAPPENPTARWLDSWCKSNK